MRPGQRSSSNIPESRTSEVRLSSTVWLHTVGMDIFLGDKSQRLHATVRSPQRPMYRAVQGRCACISLIDRVPFCSSVIHRRVGLASKTLALFAPACTRTIQKNNKHDSKSHQPDGKEEFRVDSRRQDVDLTDRNGLAVTIQHGFDGFLPGP